MQSSQTTMTSRTFPSVTLNKRVRLSLGEDEPTATSSSVLAGRHKMEASRSSSTVKTLQVENLTKAVTTMRANSNKKSAKRHKTLVESRPKEDSSSATLVDKPKYDAALRRIMQLERENERYLTAVFVGSSPAAPLLYSQSVDNAVAQDLLALRNQDTKNYINNKKSQLPLKKRAQVTAARRLSKDDVSGASAASVCTATNAIERNSPEPVYTASEQSIVSFARLIF